MSTAAEIGAAERIVTVRGLSKRYGKQVAVDGIDLEVRRGELYGLIGPDGAGKSSVMKVIAGVLAYEAGRVEVLHVPVDSERAAERIKEHIGFMPQGLGQNLYPELSVEENIDFFAELRLVPEAAREARKDRLLAITRLEPFRDRPMKQLSGGMKQKLALSCALIHEPTLVILDEPTTGVDPVSRRDFWAILAELVYERRMTAIVSTAYMDEATRFDRLSMMSGGRLLASGTPGAIERLVPGVLVAVEAEPQLEVLDRLQRTFEQVRVTGAAVHVYAPDVKASEAEERIRGALAGLSVRGVEVREPELEDVFIALARDRTSEATPEAEGERQRAPERGAAPAVGAEPAIVAEGLVRDFGRFRAVDHVSFEVLPGQIFGLLGANGAGKTTVIKMLTGILTPTAGEGRVAGADMRRGGGAIKERVGYVSQAFSLYLDLTVIENIHLFAGIYGLSRAETQRRLQWVVGMAGLRGYEPMLTGKLPLGVRQRLALGCALVHHPPVLFLDEPTSGVDPVGRRRLWSMFLRLAREEGVAILVTTHDMGEAEQCDRLALMHAGRIISAGSPAEMKRAVERDAGVLLEIATHDPLGALRRLTEAGFTDAALHGQRIHCLSLRPDEDRVRIVRILEEAGIGTATVTRRALTLEDVFVSRVSALEQAARRQGVP